MVKLARVARSEGLLALENSLDEVKDPFVQKAIQLVVDGTDANVLNEMLTRRSSSCASATWSARACSTTWARCFRPSA